jgi:hypothetical protein
MYPYPINRVNGGPLPLPLDWKFSKTYMSFPHLDMQDFLKLVYFYMVDMCLEKNYLPLPIWYF